MENVVDLKLNYDDSGVVKIQEKQISLIEQQVKYHAELKKAANSAYQAAAVQADNYSGAIQENLSQLKNQDLQLKKTSLAADLYEGAIDRLTDNLGAFKNAGLRAIEGLKGIASGMAASIKGSTGLVRVLKLVKVAFASTGIGLLVIAIAGLVTAFLRVESVGKGVRATFAGLSNAFDAFTGRLATVGQAIFGLVTGTKTLGQAAKEASGAFKGIGKEMSQAFTAGKNLQTGYEALNTKARELSVNIAENERRLAALTATANDETKSTTSRIKATQGAAAIEKKILNDQLALERERLKLQNQEIANRGRLGTTEDLEEKRAETLIRIKNIQADLISQSAEYKGAVNSLRDAERQRIEELNKAYQKVLSELDQRLNKASSAGLTGIEKLIAERDAALSELTDFQAQIEAAAAAAGVKVPESVKAQIAALVKGINDEFTLAADKYRNENPFDTIGAIIPLADKEKARDIEAIVRENTERAARAAVDAAVQARPLFQKIKDSLLSAFNVNEEELALVADLVGDSISQIDDIIFAGTQRQIAQNDALIASIEKRVSAAQQAYDAELKLQEDSFANSAKLKEEDLKAEQARLQRAQEQKEALEKKALRQQLISDSLAQASQLALGAAKVIGSESSKGLVGILTAASGIALLFRIIATAKANAAKFSAPPKFRKGGLLDGPSHEYGGIPIVVGGAQIVEAEGGEMVVSKKYTSPNTVFLKKLNEGQYQGVDLLNVAEQAKQGNFIAKGFGRMASNGANVSRKLIEHESRQKDASKAIEGKLERVIEAVESVKAEIAERPTITPLDRPYKRQYRKGRNQVTEIVRPKP